jgi:hypothetical protein
LAQDIPEGEPARIVAGDTVKFTKSLADYAPADGWVLKYTLVGPSVIANSPFTAGVVNGQWQVTIAATDTAAIVTTGTWRLIGRVELAGEKYTVFDGYVSILANVAAATQSQLLTHEERCLIAVEAVIEGRIPADLVNYQIDGKLVTKNSMKELLQLRAHYRHLVWRQRNKGKATPSRKVVFNAVD